MTDLSPAAQAVLDAALQYEINPECYSREIAAVALEAAADQVVPDERQPDIPDFPDSNQIAPFYEWLNRRNTRTKLLAIAAELRTNTTTQENN